MDLPVVALALLALVLGVALGAGAGWFFGSRPAAEWRARHRERDAEAKELSTQLSRMTAELATMSERAGRVDALGDHLRESEEARRVAENALSALKSETAEREKASEARY